MKFVFAILSFLLIFSTNANASGYSYGGSIPGFVKGTFGLQPSFDAPFLSTLVPIRAVDGTPTFTRATVRMCQDHEGEWRSLPSGAACFTGARPVWNLLSYVAATAVPTEDYSGSRWQKTDTTVTASYAIAPNGTTTSNRVEATGLWYALRSLSGKLPDLVNNNTYVFSFWVKSNTGSSQTFRLMVTSSATDYVSSDLTATTLWQRFSFSVTPSGAKTSVQAGIAKNAASDNFDLQVWGAQFEDVTGRANQNPSEYVSVGVLSAPFHGAGVDGVKYFEYENGNTVASNVVTEAQGAAISSSTLKGYIPEGARTNSVFQSRNFDTTWADTNCAGAAGSCEAKNATGIDGAANTAWTLTDDNAAARTEWQSNAVTIANDSAVHSCSVYIKKDTDQTRFPSVDCYMYNGTPDLTQQCRLNTQTGAVSFADTGSNDTCTSTLTPDGLWWRLQITATNNSLGNTRLGLYIAPAHGIVLGTSSAAATGSAIFDQAQVELNSTFASSPIVTTTAAVTRNADVLTYPATNYDATKGTALARVSSIWADSGATLVALASTTSGRMIAMGSGEGSALLKVSDGTITKNSTSSTSYQNNPLRGASSWGSAGLSIAYNNTAVVTGTFDGSMGSGALGIGSSNTGTIQWFGNISGVKLWKYKVPDSYLKRITITIPDYVLLEDGGYLLQENGDKIIKENL